MINKPYWLKLLEHYSNVEKRTGLTLPFIIGSTSLSSQFEQDNISTLLNDIKENQFKKVMLKYCTTIKEFILTVNPSLFYGSQYNMREFDNLIIIQTNGISGLDNLEDIITVLNLDYQKYIIDKKYSIVNQVWGNYTSEEEKMILEIFN